MSAENIAPIAEEASIEQFPEPPEDRYCDLVMKGGITSGVVYPRAINRLSHYYRFRGIGGTSAGAIAAAITAAAEYQRQKYGSRKGFDLLKELPQQLGQRSVLNSNKSKLLSLFQPQPNTRRLFAVLIRTLNRGSTRSRWFGGVEGLLLEYWPATVVSTVIAFVFALNGAWFTGLLSMAIALLVSIGILVYFDITRGVVANGFGLCNGMTEKKDLDALTPWLHEMIQLTAGRSKDDDPLTFGDLWGADDNFPPDWLKAPEEVNAARKRSIDLQMFSTNLTHGRPYVFPLSEPETGESRFRSRERLYFTEEEMRHYLPPNVVDWMVEKSNPYGVENGREGKDPPTEAGLGMRELPKPEDFPVLLAARMSLAFPFLISAIPLHAINHDLPPGKRKFHRCWFSDGGISSNFPIHLFDGLVPIWPTFGIHLEPEIKDREESYLPQAYDKGYGESWSLFAEKPKSVGKLGGFISAIINAMQNWNDNTLRRLPGFRDRVVRVRLKDGEGGMNLNSKRPVLPSINFFISMIQ